MTNDAGFYLREKDKQSLQFLLSHKEGRWFLLRLFDRCHVLNNEPAPIENLQVFEGERRAVYQILQAISFLGKEGLTARHLAETEYFDELKKIKEMGENNVRY